MSHALPASRPEAGPVFTLQNVGHQAFIPHGAGGSPRGGVKHGTGVAGSVCAEAVYLQRPSVIQMSAHRSAHNGNAHDFLSVRAADGELVSHHRLMVSVVLLHKGVRLLERHRAYFKAHSFAPSYTQSINCAMVVMVTPHHSCRLARTSADATGGHTALPHRATCALFLYSWPS